MPRAVVYPCGAGLVVIQSKQGKKMLRTTSNLFTIPAIRVPDDKSYRFHNEDGDAIFDLCEDHLHEVFEFPLSAKEIEIEISLCRLSINDLRIRFNFDFVDITVYDDDYWRKDFHVPFTVSDWAKLVGLSRFPLYYVRLYYYE